MSIEVIESQIKKFLSEKKTEVMAISGKWGVGKTYSWKKFLQDAKERKQIASKKYAYVSLFGIGSLERLRHSIFENSIDRGLIGKEPNIDTLKENLLKSLGPVGKKFWSLFKGLSAFESFAPLMDAYSSLSVNETLICVDDLERRGEGLLIEDVLGLISKLKEQKGCKIVLLLNESEEGTEGYFKLREKVVDLELKFNPTPEECTSIAIEKPGFEFERLKEQAHRLRITNIRLLKKIERLVELVAPIIKDYDNEVKVEVIGSIVLFSWCHFNAGMKDIPPLDFVTGLGIEIFIGEEKDEDETRKNWKEKIREYGYQGTDELDLVLAEAVKSGFVYEDALKRKAEEKNKGIIALKSQGSFRKAWEPYHNSFKDNADEVIQAIYEGFKPNVKFISPTNLNGAVGVLKALGENEKASELIDLYIKERKEEVELFNLESDNIIGSAPDPEIEEKFGFYYESTIRNETMEEIVARLSKMDGWNQKDEIVLANSTVEEFYKLFKNADGPHLTSYVKTCLQFCRFANPTERQYQIGKKAEEALIRIGKESDLNKLRVGKFGIRISEDEEAKDGN